MKLIKRTQATMTAKMTQFDDNGNEVKGEFDITFRMPTPEQRQAIENLPDAQANVMAKIFAEMTAKAFCQVIVGFEGLLDAEGTPIPCTEATIQDLLYSDVGGPFFDAMFSAYLQFVGGRRPKNLPNSPAGGQSESPAVEVAALTTES